MYNNDLPNRAELPSSKKLLISTLTAIIVATVLLVTIVLPAEYGIDPIRIGRVLGLTQMGETKMRLAAEAKKDAETTAKTNPNTNTTVAQKPVPPTEKKPATTKADAMTITLKPSEGTEIKMDLVKGAKVKFEWNATGLVNHDTHGEGANKAFISYKKGVNVESDAGELIAEFDGSHGWFWRNRTANDVTITVKASGEFEKLKKM
jgi:hypothetical protein